jgi:hypothetical protein
MPKHNTDFTDRVNPVSGQGRVTNLSTQLYKKHNIFTHQTLLCIAKQSTSRAQMKYKSVVAIHVHVCCDNAIGISRSPRRHTDEL